jgi:arylsulfatase A-like enzyme
LLLFLSDNGACAEDIPEGVNVQSLVDDLMIAQAKTRDGRPVLLGNDPTVMPGPEDTYQSYGVAWANMSNAPFRLYKHWIHEGGISTPLIVHWPEGIEDKGGVRHVPGQLPDLMATVLEITGAIYPQNYKGNEILPLEGISLTKSFDADYDRQEPLFWEHEGNAAVRVGKWKLVRNYPDAWELYDMQSDRTETKDLAATHPDRVKEMLALYEDWAKRCGVIPREKILEEMKKLGGTAFWEKDEEEKP